MIITVTHQKGGVLKTTIAHHLAHGLKKQGYNVVVFDMDAQQTISIVNNIRENNNKEPLETYSPSSISELIELFEEHKNKTIICDNAGMDSDMNRHSMEVADKVIVPLMASINDILGLEKFYSTIEEIDENIRINALLVKVHHSRTNFKMIEDLIGDREIATLLKTKIVDNKISYESMEKGMSVFDTDNTLRKNYEKLIEELSL